jgi:lambda family phage portal protein
MLQRRLRSALRGKAGELTSWIAGESPLGYDAGRHSRLDAGYVPRNLGPNALGQETLELLRARSRHLVDNNPIVGGALQTHTDNIVGRGIDVRPMTGIEELDRELARRWKAFAEGVDPSRTLTLRDHQRLFCTELLASGEVLVVDSIVPARASTRGEWARGPAVELVEAERLDVGFVASGGTVIESASGNGRQRVAAQVPEEHTVLQSVELDASGVPVAYWVREAHPRDLVAGLVAQPLLVTSRRRVATDRARLCFVMRRPKQLRGVPWTAKIIADSRMESGFLEASLVQARIAACTALVFAEDGDTGPLAAGVGNGANGASGEGAENEHFVDSTGKPITELSPGLIGFSSKGEPKVVGSNLPAPGLEMVCRMMHNRQAAGLGMSAAEVSRNYKGTTFSAARTELLSTMRGVHPMQAYVYENSTRPLYRTWVWWLVTSGQLQLKAEYRKKLGPQLEQLYECMPTYPGTDWVNPAQEAAAAETELALGIVSRTQLCAAKGRNFEEVLQQTLSEELREKQLREKMGLPPRVSPATALAQNGQAANVDEQTGEQARDDAGEEAGDQAGREPDEENTQDNARTESEAA